MVEGKKICAGCCGLILVLGVIGGLMNPESMDTGNGESNARDQALDTAEEVGNNVGEKINEESSQVGEAVKIDPIIVTWSDDREDWVYMECSAGTSGNGYALQEWAPVYVKSVAQEIDEKVNNDKTIIKGVIIEIETLSYHRRFTYDLTQ